MNTPAHCGAIKPPKPDIYSEAPQVSESARSMKAGAFTPATPEFQGFGSGRRTALNEGGGFHPRNPGWRWGW